MPPTLASFEFDKVSLFRRIVHLHARQGAEKGTQRARTRSKEPFVPSQTWRKARLLRASFSWRYRETDRTKRRTCGTLDPFIYIPARPPPSGSTISRFGIHLHARCLLCFSSPLSTSLRLCTSCHCASHELQQFVLTQRTTGALKEPFTDQQSCHHPPAGPERTPDLALLNRSSDHCS